ncbi:MAG: hypothetical protein AB7F86_14540 [Bdellovibrionales bacterium]
MRLFCLISIFMWAASASAEYRVFELVIQDPTTGQERTELSTLDPNQYRGYHPVKAEERVTYSATWMCRGSTAGRPLCSRPEDPSPISPSLDRPTAR